MMIRFLFPLCLAAALSLPTQAGFLIDGFGQSGSTVVLDATDSDAVGATRTVTSFPPGSGAVTMSAGNGMLSGANTLITTAEYDFGGLDLSGTPTLVLENMGIVGATEVLVGLDTEVQMFNVATPDIPFSGDLTFDFSGFAGLSNVEGLSVAFLATTTPTGGFFPSTTFTLDAIRAVPEPTSLMLFGLAAGGGALVYRRRRG